MYKSLIIAASLLVSSAAFAQGTNSQTSTQNSQTNSQMDNPGPATQAQGQPTAQIANQIRKNLQQAGFKNIKLMPSSFIVRAEDQNNNPVMMVINPDSVTAVSAVNQNGQNTTGQASGNGTGRSNNKTGQ